MTKLRIGRLEASIEEGVWSCPEPAVQRALQVMVPVEGVSSAFPDPDLALAIEAAELLGGEVVDPPKAPETSDNTVY
jgi:hypothetical protein